MRRSAHIRVRMVADPFSVLCARGFASLREAQLHLANTSGIHISLEILPFPKLMMDTESTVDDIDYASTLTLLTKHEIHAPSPSGMEGRSEAEGAGAAAVADSSNALRLIHRAGSSGASAEVFGCLLHACHVEGRDISDPAVLAHVAEACALRLSNIHEYLTSEEDLDDMQRDMQFLFDASLAGVPAYIIGENMKVLLGCQCSETLEKAVYQAVSEIACGPSLLIDTEDESKQANAAIKHISVCVTSVSMARLFYEQCIGLNEPPEDDYDPTEQRTSGAGDSPSLRLAFPGGSPRSQARQELHFAKVDEQPQRPGPHVCIFVPTLQRFDAIVASLADEGVDTAALERSPFRGRALLKDFDGNTVELDTHTPCPLRLVPPETIALHHVSINVPREELVAARAFYKDILKAPLIAANKLCLGSSELHLVDMRRGHHPEALAGTASHQHVAVALESETYAGAAKRAAKEGRVVGLSGLRRFKLLRRLSPSPSPHHHRQRPLLIRDRCKNTVLLLPDQQQIGKDFVDRLYRGSQEKKQA